MLSVKPSLKIVATLLAKNEEDIIGLNIEHHLRQGVSQFIVTDNNSTDRTREIVEQYPEVVEIIDEPEDDHNQSKWVTRMARLACKLHPDWIIHLDADELWGNLMHLRNIRGKVAGCERMFLHPPIHETFDWKTQKYYLDFSTCGIPDECKVVHRPNPEIIVAHGNHGVVNDEMEFTQMIYRHHYPVRSYEQWARKAEGNVALKRRGASCDRWENWYNLLTSGKLIEKYSKLTQLWRDMIHMPSHDKLISLLEFWATPEMISFFKSKPEIMPNIEEWYG